MNQSWKFIKADPANASTVGFDDAAWETVNIPHSANYDPPTIEGEQKSVPQSSDWDGVHWYRKRFVVPSTEHNQKVFIEFDGAMQITEVYINGKPAGTHDACGYTGFHFDITDVINRTGDNLCAIYLGSVGRNCVLLLNLPPDKRGLIHPTDSARIGSLGGWIRGTFATNLASDAAVTALHPRGDEYAPSYMIDTSENTYYAGTDDFSTDTLEFDLGTETTFDCIMIQEKIELGHRITQWHCDAYYNGKWNDISGNKRSIGYKRLISSSEMTASKVRLCITDGKACPAIHTFGIYRSTFAHPPVVKVVEPLVAQVERFLPSSHLSVLGNRFYLPRKFFTKNARVTLYDLCGRIILQSTLCTNATYVHLPRSVMTHGVLVVTGDANEMLVKGKVVIGK